MQEPCNHKGFWEHYCEAEGEVIGTESGKPCNWCDAQEPQKDPE
jgi:hypothetical protein